MTEDYRLENQHVADFNFITVINVLKAQWHWFVLSVVVCIGVAWYYNQVHPVPHKQAATVLVKDKEKTEDAFIEKQLFNVNSNLANEQLIFKSRLLMTEVVRRLGIATEYTVKDGFKKNVLYPNSPIQVELTTTPKNMVTFSVHILSATNYEMTDFSGDLDWSFKGTFGIPLETPMGKLIISATSHLIDDFFNETIDVSIQSPQTVASQCLGKLEVERAEKESTLLTISYTDSNPERAGTIISTLIDVYNDDAIQDKNLILLNTAQFIDERLLVINQELGQVDGDIESYKKVNKLTDLSSEANLYLQNNNTNRQEGVLLANQMELVLFIKGFMQNPAKDWELLPANSGIMDTGVEGLIGQYNEKILTRGKLLRSSGNKNPAIESLDEQIVSLRETIFHSLTNLHNSLRIKLNEARQQENITSLRIGTVPTQEKYIMSIERQQKIKEELYLYLLNKREENALSMATVEKKIRVIDTPYNAGVASGLNTTVLFLIAFIVGILLPGLFFYIQPMLDVTVRSRKDLKDVLTIPFLGEIPRKKKVLATVVIDKDTRDNISEAFRVLRANLDYVLVRKEGAHVLMFTSANPDSGKTFISSNLAVSLAMTGKRVMYLNMDIRKGSGRQQNGGFVPGMTNYLSGKTDDWKNLIHNSEEYPSLFMIHSGPIPPNPAELLLSERLDVLADALRKEYDYVIIDTVPYGMMADAQIINRVADVTVYVIREGLMDRRMLPEVESLYKENKLRNMTVILNDSGIKGSHYGYYGYGYYGYGYKYGYKYGYGSKKRKKR